MTKYLLIVLLLTTFSATSQIVHDSILIEGHTDPKDGKTIEQYTFKKRRKPEVTLLKVIGGKHDYPNDIDVHLAAWAFFKRQM